MNSCGNASRINLLFIDGYENKVLRGRFGSAQNNEEIPFVSTIDFLAKMESVLEEMKLPQAFSERRTFRKTGSVAPPEGSAQEFRKGELATFTLRVLFRQNASWQGSLHWQEEEQVESFRSVLELLLLIDSALS